MLFSSFLWGMLAAAATLILETLFLLLSSQKEIQLSPEFYSRITIFLFVSIAIEETVKYFAILKNNTNFPHLLRQIFAAILFGLGFSFSEIALLAWTESFLFSYWMLVLGNVFLHIITSLFFAYYILRQNQRSLKKSTSIVPPLAVGFSLHFFYNILMIYNFSPWLIWIYLAACSIFLFYRWLDLIYHTRNSGLSNKNY